MTISQSRYGGAAEVGRAPSRPARKTDRNVYGVFGGAGVAGAGYAAASHGKSTARSLTSTHDKATERASNARRNANPVDGKYRLPSGMMTSKDRAQKELLMALQDHKNAEHAFFRGMPGAKRMIRGGRLAALAGLVGAGAAGVNLEAKRGTVGVRRPTRVEAQRAQVSGRRKEIAEGQAAGDRYRRMNGM